MAFKDHAACIKVGEPFKTHVFYFQCLWFKTNMQNLWKVPKNHIPWVKPNHVREIGLVSWVADEAHDEAITCNNELQAPG